MSARIVQQSVSAKSISDLDGGVFRNRRFKRRNFTVPTPLVPTEKNTVPSFVLSDTVATENHFLDEDAATGRPRTIERRGKMREKNT